MQKLVTSIVFSESLMVFIKSMPKDSCVHFYHDSWREGDKYGVNLCLIELIFNVSSLVVCDWFNTGRRSGIRVGRPYNMWCLWE